MKILDVTEFYSERGGGVRSHLTLKSHVLCQLGVEHVIAAPGPKDTTSESVAANGSTHSNGRSKIVRIAGPSLPYDPTYHLLWRVDKIRALVERERPDVLGIHSPYVAAASALSVPRSHFGVRVFTWHSDFIDTYLRVMLERHVTPKLASVALEPLWAMVRGIARGCDATFVAAAWQEEKLREHGVERVVRVPFGIERRDFSAAKASDARKRELVGDRARGKDVKLLVGVGRFAVEKRWDVVIDAFKLARSRGLEAVLALFGDGPERDRMRAQVEGRDDVVFLGFERDRTKLASALGSADALVHGCPYETFGLSIAEALACGLPVIVPDEGGATEMAEATCAEVYESLDVEACARAIERMVSRDREEMRRGAIERASRVLSVEEQFARELEELKGLLRARRA